MLTANARTRACSHKASRILSLHSIEGKWEGGVRGEGEAGGGEVCARYWCWRSWRMRSCRLWRIRRNNIQEQAVLWCNILSYLKWGGGKEEEEIHNKSPVAQEVSDYRGDVNIMIDLSLSKLSYFSEMSTPFICDKRFLLFIEKSTNLYACAFFSLWTSCLLNPLNHERIQTQNTKKKQLNTISYNIICS